MNLSARQPTSQTESPTFEAFYRDNLAPMVRLAHLLTGSNEAAEDLVQDAFVKVRARLGELQTPEAYLRTTVVNGCRSWFRRKDVETRHAHTPREQLQLQPELEELWDALGQLPSARRAALFLRYYEDLPVDEIAEILGCRSATVRSHLRRGLAALKEMVPDDYR